MQTGKAISIPSILKVGNGTLNKIGEYLKSEELTSVVIFMGNGLIDMFGDTIMKSLTDAGITVLEYSELDTVEIDDIITLAFEDYVGYGGMLEKSSSSCVGTYG